MGVHLWAKKRGHIWREIPLCCLGWFTKLDFKEIWWLTPEISAHVKRRRELPGLGS